MRRALQAQRGAGDAERGDDVARVAAHRRGHGGQAGLELVDRRWRSPGGGPVASSASSRSWSVMVSGVKRRQRRRAARRRRRRPGRPCPRAVQWKSTRAVEPLAGAEEVLAVDLREVLDAAGRRDGEVDRLAAEPGERVERLGRELDEVAVDRAAVGVAQQRGPRARGAPRAAVLVHEPVALERAERAREAVLLGSSAARPRSPSAHRLVALEHHHEQLRGAVDRPACRGRRWPRPTPVTVASQRCGTLVP